MLTVFQYHRDIDGFQGIGQVSSVFLWANLMSIPYDQIQFQWIANCEKNNMICFERKGHVVRFSWSQEAFRDEYVNKKSEYTRDEVISEFYTSVTEVRRRLEARKFCTYSMMKRVGEIKRKFDNGESFDFEDILCIQRTIAEGGCRFISISELKNTFS